MVCPQPAITGVIPCDPDKSAAIYLGRENHCIEAFIQGHWTIEHNTPTKDVLLYTSSSSTVLFLSLTVYFLQGGDS